MNLIYIHSMAITKEGAIKIAAKKLCLSVDQYRKKIDIGLKHCTICKKWHKRELFSSDLSRGDGLYPSCTEGRNQKSRSIYIPKPKVKRQSRSFVQARDGDAKQARRRINYFVSIGLIPHPSTVPCTDCGQVWIKGLSRHEYDHYLGYEAIHHESVEVVCTTCHTSREMKRGKWGR